MALRERGAKDIVRVADCLVGPGDAVTSAHGLPAFRAGGACIVPDATLVLDAVRQTLAS